jgi:SPP1 family predicted phage head-tail adaptor
MQAGRLRHSVIVQRPGGSRDAVGARLTTFTDIATVPASIEPLVGREQFLAAERQASTTHKVTLRYASSISSIDATWRVKFGTRIFVIDEPPRNTDERNREITLFCTEGLRDE